MKDRAMRAPVDARRSLPSDFVRGFVSAGLLAAVAASAALLLAAPRMPEALRLPTTLGSALPSPGELLDLAASVEEHYFHPLALAVVEAARRHRGRHFDHTEVQFIAAHGVASVIHGNRIVVGSRHFVEEDKGIPVGRHRSTIDRLCRQGKIVLFIGFARRLVAVIALKDSVCATSAATVRRLRALG